MAAACQVVCLGWPEDMQKRISFLAIGACLLATHAISQNIVPNPGFEEYKTLPCKINEFKIQELLSNWTQPLGTTTDYYNKSSSPSCELNPDITGMLPRTGSAMTGLIAAHIVRNFASTYREYVQVKLNTPLEPNHLYYSEFYAINRNKVMYASDILESNNLGIALTGTEILDFSYTASDHIYLNTVVKETSLIKAGDSWRKIGGCFVADTGHQFLLIGNFDSPENTNVARLSNQNEEATAYYFIDDVTLTELSYPVSNLSDEIFFCSAESSIELSASVPGATSYKWETGETTSSIQVFDKKDNFYQVDIQFNECLFNHKFKVTFVPDIDLGPADTVLCREEKLTLELEHPFDSFIWNDGSTDAKKIISEAGMVWVEVPSYCPVRDTLNVTYVDCPGELPNIITPNGDNLNEFFKVEHVENRKWNLRVYNRWGKEVYYTEHYLNDWSAKGLSDGIYYYIMDSHELGKTVKGWIEVAR
jgi:gliding motility-associated-like protein